MRQVHRTLLAACILLALLVVPAVVSAAITGPDTSPPASVTDLHVATRTTSSITWTWTDPADDDFAQVRIYRDGVSVGYVGRGVHTYTLTGLDPYTAYRISARTLDLAGNYNATVISSTAMTLSEDTTPPATVTNMLVANRTYTSVTWTWTDPADADFAKVAVYLNGASMGFVDRGVQTYTATGLNPGTAYRLSTLTYDQVGNYNTTMVSKTTMTLSPDTTPPAGVTNLHVTNRTLTTITFTWTDPADDDFWKVRVFQDGVCHGYTAKGVQTRTMTGLTPNIEYRFDTRTYDRVGNYNRTNVTLIASPLSDYDPPGRVTNLQVTDRTATTLTWTWTDPTDPDFVKVAVYRDGVKMGYVAQGVQSYSMTGLAPNTTYRISILTYDLANNYNPILVTDAATTLGEDHGDTTPPASVTDLRVAARNTTAITWEWTDPADPDFARVAISLDSTFKGYVEKGVRTWTETGIAPNTSATLQTQTCDESGNFNTTLVNSTGTTLPLPDYPNADFTANRTTGVAPFAVQFEDRSDGSGLVSWEWDFEDDGVYDAFDQNPVHVYGAPGTYAVRLQATNAAGADSETKTGYIVVTAPARSITGVSPSSAYPGQTLDSLYVYGTGFEDGDQVAVVPDAGGSSTIDAQDVIRLNSTAILCTLAVPADAAPGPCTVSVRTTAGASATLPGAFTITGPAPVVTGFSPGSARAGETIDSFYVYGEGFTGDVRVFVSPRTGDGSPLIEATGASPVNGTAIRCTLSIPADAVTGPYSVLVRANGTESAGSDPFLVAPSTQTVVKVPGGIDVPTDHDGDRLYEDLNGNGGLDFADLVLYFNSMDWIAANEPVGAFDYNGNGAIDFADVVWLFNQL